MDIIRLGQEEESIDIIVLDLVIVLLSPQSQKPIVQFNGVSATRREECTFGLLELHEDISGSFSNTGRLHDALLQQLGRVGNRLVVGIYVWIWGDIESHGNCEKQRKTKNGKTGKLVGTTSELVLE